MNEVESSESSSPVIVEQFNGDAWIEVGRFESIEQASRALDEMAEEGVRSDHLRISYAPTHHHRGK